MFLNAWLSSQNASTFQSWADLMPDAYLSETPLDQLNNGKLDLVFVSVVTFQIL